MMDVSHISKEQLYRTARFMRAFELAIGAAADRGAAPGLVHLSLGAELWHAALAHVAETHRDRLFGSHRSHTLALAMGADPQRVACEILGRIGGLSEGRGGTQHLMDSDSGFVSSTGIVGSQVPLAAGAALAIKHQNTGGVAIAVMGDGAVNQGAVSEALNLAVVMALPLLVIVENNGIAQSTDSAAVTAGSLQARARAMGLATRHLPTTCSDSMLETLSNLLGYCRHEQAPALLEVMVPRLSGHFHGGAVDHAQRAQDPLALLADHVDAAAAIDAEEEARAFAIVGAAEAAPYPEAADG